LPGMPFRSRRVRREGVSSLLCTPGDISILRRHCGERRGYQMLITMRCPVLASHFDPPTELGAWPFPFCLTV
jgi:hypothetical protein